jgi:uncharacterized protein
MIMLVKAIVKESAIEGVGIFADEDIKAGTVVWRYVEPIDQKFSTERIAQMPAILQDYLQRYGYDVPQTDLIIHCGDNARFMNHADNPNTLANYSDDLTIFEDVAARDIKRGEEFTCRYFSVDWNVGDKGGVTS